MVRGVFCNCKDGSGCSPPYLAFVTVFSQFGSPSSFSQQDPDPALSSSNGPSADPHSYPPPTPQGGGYESLGQIP